MSNNGSVSLATEPRPATDWITWSAPALASRAIRLVGLPTTFVESSGPYRQVEFEPYDGDFDVI
jgi:hypothetical protein